MILRDQTIWGVLDSACASCPHKELLIVDGVRYTYHEVRQSAARLAQSLANLHIGARDVIGLWLPNGIEWIVSLFASARLNAIAVGINTRLRLAEVKYLLEKSQAKALVVSHAAGSFNYIDGTYELLPELREDPAQIWPRFPHLQHVICTGTKTVPGMRLWSDLLMAEPHGSGLDHASPKSVALLQYTSGSTGHPKGAQLLHGAVTRNGFGTGERMGLNKNDKLFAPNPFFHVAGTVTGLLNAVTHQATLVTMRHYEAGEALEVLEREQCTARLGVDTMYQRELEHADFKRRNLQHLRKGICMGGSQIFRRVYHEMGMSDIISVYALSEASPNVTSTVPADPLDIRALTVGKPQAGVELKIVDVASGNSVGPGQIGEIMVRGWNVMDGYFNDPSATALAIDDEGWLHTGDMGQLDLHSNLVFSGRLKDVIRVGGENVSALEVEDVLLSCPAVKIAQVVAMPDRDLGEVPIAFVQLNPGESYSEQDLGVFCVSRIARFKIPRRFQFVQEWPMTGSGKIHKVILREWAADLNRSV